MFTDEMKARIMQAVTTGAIIGAFILFGLAMFAGKVFEDHTKMQEQMQQLAQSMRIEMTVLQVKQMETNARVIEMRRMCK